MLNELAFGMGNVEGEGSKPGSVGSAGAKPRETKSKLKGTAGVVGSENETALVMPMVNDSHPRIHYPFSTMYKLCNYHHNPSS